MATPIKHIGMIENTGRKCVVVFREIYDERGNPTDIHNCLVCETDSLPDAIHESMMRIVESEPAQRTGDFYEVLTRERFPDGSNALNYLHASGRLRKIPTDQIVMMPVPGQKIPLSQINTIVRMQATGASQADIENVLQDDTDSAPRASGVTATADGVATPVPAASVEAVAMNETVLDDATLARQWMAESKMLMEQAEDLKTRAIELDASVKPTRGRPAKKKA